MIAGPSVDFFDCRTALRVLADLEARVRPGGTAIVNVRVEDTTFLDMFDAEGCCLFARTGLEWRFADWDGVPPDSRQETDTR
jgi:tellurite methyltransferase